MRLLGSVNGKDAIIVDDIADSCATLYEASITLKLFGANRITAFCIHPIFSENFCENISNSSIDFLAFSNSLPVSAKKIKALSDSKKITILILDISKMLTDAILSI